MYKTTLFLPKVNLIGGNVSKDYPPQVENYINDFIKDGWELVSMAFLPAAGLLFVWKKM